MCIGPWVLAGALRVHQGIYRVRVFATRVHQGIYRVWIRPLRVSGTWLDVAKPLTGNNICIIDHDVVVIDNSNLLIGIFAYDPVTQSR